MKVLRRVILVALAGSPLAAHPVAAQTPAADLVTAARAQLWKGNADSGLALLRLALDSSTRATASDRMNALVWRGVLQYYKGQDSLARESFRDALTIDPRLEVAGLAQVDSILAVKFEGVRRSIQLPPTASRRSRSRSTTSSACSPIRRSANWATCSSPRASRPMPPASST